MSSERNIPFGRPWITEGDKEAVLRVLSGHILTHGPECKEFEKAFAGFIGEGAHTLTVSSCMAALHMAYLHLGVGAGDEVIVPALTHVATVHAVEWVGARPVLVDCDRDTGNISADSIAAAISPRTRALGLVHFAGIPCDMTAIMALAERHRLKVVEDCAIALGARWAGIHVGMFGDLGCFSFYPVKHITTGEGGMALSRHAAVISAIGKLRAFGVDRPHGERAMPGMYEVASLGLNYRMSEMQAALGRSQTARLPENLRRRRENFETLKTELVVEKQVRVLDAQTAEASNSHYCLVAVLEGDLGRRRNEIVARLNQKGVGTSIYYPQPVGRMIYYREKYGYDPGLYPNAARISDCSIALPVGVHVSLDDSRYIAATFRQTLKEFA